MDEDTYYWPGEEFYEGEDADFLARYDGEWDDLVREWNGLGGAYVSEYNDSGFIADPFSEFLRNFDGEDDFGDGENGLELPFEGVLSDHQLERLIESVLRVPDASVRQSQVTRVHQLNERMYQLYLEHYQTLQDEETMRDRLAVRPSAPNLAHRLESIREWKAQLERQMDLLQSDQRRLVQILNG